MLIGSLFPIVCLLPSNAIQQGYEVYLLSRDTGRKQFLQGKGIRFIDIPFDRSGSNPLHELKCIFQLYTNYKKYRPNIIHHVTLKAALLGSVAAKLSRATSCCECNKWIGV
ncbi:hypothetical protein NIB75_08095 [Bacteroides uniformis]|nr:hypothetical protein [Bacteroides uniformis]